MYTVVYTIGTMFPPNRQLNNVNIFHKYELHCIRLQLNLTICLTTQMMELYEIYRVRVHLLHMVRSSLQMAHTHTHVLYID